MEPLTLKMMEPAPLVCLDFWPRPRQARGPRTLSTTGDCGISSPTGWWTSELGEMPEGWEVKALGRNRRLNVETGLRIT